MSDTMDDAFAHHVWATLKLIDTCFQLDPAQLDTTVPGTYGSIIDTMRHVVDGDAFYLAIIGAEEAPPIDVERMNLTGLRAAMEANGARWAAFLGTQPDPAEVVLEAEPDGFRREATVGLRLAQAVHHGTDHRSQICTALSALGVEPPTIDVWEFGLETSRSVEVEPPEPPEPV